MSSRHSIGVPSRGKRIGYAFSKDARSPGKVVMTWRLRAPSVAVVLIAAGCSTVFGIPDSIEFGSSPLDAGAEDRVTPSPISSPPDATATGPGCLGLGANCAFTQNCCLSQTVEGGTFYRSYDGADDGQFVDESFPAAVGSFKLDVFEVTVGRFRAFLADYRLPEGVLQDGAADDGWKSVPRDAASFLKALGTCGTWTATPYENHETLPMDCITWYEAFAFCVWDGGRLPTEAEWNYAAAGGDQQRAYPWSDNPFTSLDIDGTDALYVSDSAVRKLPSSVGLLLPKGRGRWGHADLAGNVSEWVLDSYGPYPATCIDCAVDSPGGQRVLRGGDFASLKENLRVAHRVAWDPTNRETEIGVRCAREAGGP
jgi:formylglycine-generating enzyme required for sulfatase activity